MCGKEQRKHFFYISTNENRSGKEKNSFPKQPLDFYFTGCRRRVSKFRILKNHGAYVQQQQEYFFSFKFK